MLQHKMQENIFFRKMGATFFVALFCFVFVRQVLASEPDAISIKTQPYSSDTVDYVFSQQPKVMVQDADGNPVPEITVTAFKTMGSGSLRGTLTAKTGPDGMAVFSSLGYNKTDDLKISFIYSGGSPVSSNTIQLSAGAVSSLNSSLSADLQSVLADGQDQITVFASCKDQYQNPVPGAKVVLSVAGSENDFAQPKITDDSGKTSTVIASTKAEQKTISAVAGGVSFGHVGVDFVPGKLAKIEISGTGQSVQREASMVSLAGFDSFGNAVKNDSSTKISLSVDNGASLDSSLVKFESGVAKASVLKDSPGVVNLAVSAGNVNNQFKIVFTSSDTEPPQVSGQFPRADSKDVSISILAYVDFSEQVDINTLISENLQLKKKTDNSIVPADILIGNAGRRAIVQPNTLLDFATEYYIHAEKIADSAGNILKDFFDGGVFTTVADDKTQAVVQNNLQDAQNGTQSENQFSSSRQTGLPEPGAGDDDDTNPDAVPDEDDIAPQSAGALIESLFSKNGQAGILGSFENMSSFKISTQEIGEWFVSNFAWIILGAVIIFLGYIFLIWKQKA